MATITGNGTSSVICTGEWKYYSEAFANTTEGPNGDYSPSTVVDALNAFTSSAFAGCTLEVKAVVAAPSTKVRVSQVTATSTRHVATGVKPLPDAGIGFSVESEGSDVSASSASGDSCGDHAITYTHTSGLDVTTGCIGASSGPVVHATVTDGLHPTPSETQQQIGVESETKKPGYSDITLPFFGPIGIRPTEQPSPLPTQSPGSSGDSGSQPVVALPVTQSPSQGQGGSNGQDGSNGQGESNGQNESNGQDGSNGQIASNSPNGSNGQGESSGQNESNGQDGSNGQIASNSPNGSNGQGESSGQDGSNGQIGSNGQNESNGQDGSSDQNQSNDQDGSNGQNESNGQNGSNDQGGSNAQDGSNGQIASNSQNGSNGQGESNGQDNTNGQSGSNNQNGANDQGGSNGQSESGGQDVSNLPSPTVIRPPAQITVGSQTYTANPSSQFVIGSQTLEAGGDAITHEGHTISLGPSASNIVIDSSTGVISYPIVTTLLPTALPVLTIDNQPVTANGASEYIIGSQTLVPGGSAIIISGTPVSLAPSESAIVIGGSTKFISSPSVTAAPVLTINNQPVTANSASEYIIQGQTLIPGGPAITVSGTPISLAPSASDVVVGSSTEALGPIIMDGFGPSGATAGSMGSGSANSTATSPEAFTGGAGLVRKIKVWRVAAVGLGIGMVMAFMG